MCSRIAPTMTGTVVLKEGYQHEEEEGGKHRLRRVLEGDVLTTPTKPRILVYIITFCGFNSPPATTQQVMSRAIVSTV